MPMYFAPSATSRCRDLRPERQVQQPLACARKRMTLIRFDHSPFEHPATNAQSAHVVASECAWAFIRSIQAVVPLSQTRADVKGASAVTRGQNNFSCSNSKFGNGDDAAVERKNSVGRTRVRFSFLDRAGTAGGDRLGPERNVSD